jgi:hypothetical protein
MNRPYPREKKNKGWQEEKYKLTPNDIFIKLSLNPGVQTWKVSKKSLYY